MDKPSRWFFFWWLPEAAALKEAEKMNPSPHGGLDDCAMHAAKMGWVSTLPHVQEQTR